jgi:hypothetical protein
VLYKLAKFELNEEEARGIPPYRTQWEVRLTESERDMYDKEMGFWTRVALVEFPDPKSCLEDGVDPVTPETLTRMDWAKFRGTEQVAVCTFRLLAPYGDISHASAWFEHQGFELDGTLRVYGRWSIRDNGAKFHQSGMLHALNPFTPYDMNIHSFWSADGKGLLYIDIGYSYK